MSVRRAVLAAGLLVAVVGGLASWRAVAEMDDAHTRAAAARRDLADLEGAIRARLDEAAGRVGLGAGPTSDDELTEILAAVGGPADLAEEVVAREAELRDDVGADGVPDERLLSRLETTLRELERTTVDPAADEARDAQGAAQATIAVVAVASTGLWAAAARLGWSTAPDPAPA